MKFDIKYLLCCLPKDFEDDQRFIKGNKDATTVTIDDPIKSRRQRKSAETGFQEDINDPLNNDDKTEVNEIKMFT